MKPLETKNRKTTVDVEKWVYGGDALSRIDGQVLLTPFALPGERIEVEPEGAKGNLLRARSMQVIEPSPRRVEPQCEYFGRCGGCQYQHADYAYQIGQKVAILRETLRRLGWLNRMTQYKAKAEKQETVGAGLLQYPVLMAADILVYQAKIVPVGEDQSQHLELARDIAQRFNSMYGDTFVMPETRLPAVGARIMGLDDPTTKMSKSVSGTNHAIALLDEPSIVRKKIARATTDSQPAVDPENMGPGVANLFTIAHACDPFITKNSVAGMRYGDFKKLVAEAVVSRLEPIQRKYREITADPGYIDSVLLEGQRRVLPIAENTIRNAKRAMGLYVANR
jgi:tryptophanyl-tRNA synthetase